ncbi:M23 family metallopeptidase [Pseudohalioglobus sediminis]|uniref:M23 family metallopeptidase n=1 Tax=Pseudohalioglobus sediminis TaxID=2606449 RepID=A0A5B0X2H8_9GAMM|nr:M23 family metallopeptidase [Pseudohalioglobus sediminis]KAA1192747.1 M23 family metallopeptidase [Pseudohalioglobus sediminis]
MKYLIVAFTVLAGSMAASANCPPLQGNLVQGGLVWGKTTPDSAVSLDGNTLDVLADGTFFAAFGRDAAASAELVIEGEQPCRQSLPIRKREYRISRVEGVPQKTVTPSPEHLDRIARERALVRAAKGQRLQRPDLLQDALAGFAWPATGRISGVYGSQRYYNGKPGNPHYGVDVAVPTGTPVYAPSSGVVTLAQPDLFYSGGTVILDHGFGLSSSFLHMSKLHVNVGQEVRTGELIGEVGATGRATGPHLDWRMSWRNERVDPQLLVPEMVVEADAPDQP